MRRSRTSAYAAVVIDIRNAEDARDVVHRAVQALAEGQLVALPTETVYGLGRQRLPARRRRAAARKSKGRPADQPLGAGDQECRRSAPISCPICRRSPAGWPAAAGPGPVTLVVDNGHRDGLIGQLPREVRQIVAPNGTVGLRVPANEMSLDVLRMLTGPIVLTSANRSGQPEAVTAQEVVRVLGRRRGAGARRRPLPLRPAVVRRARQKQSLRSSARRRRRRSHAASGWPA